MNSHPPASSSAASVASAASASPTRTNHSDSHSHNHPVGPTSNGTTSNGTTPTTTSTTSTSTIKKPMSLPLHKAINAVMEEEVQDDIPSPRSQQLRTQMLVRDNRSLSERKTFTPTADKLILVMVGLPARGKSFIAKKLCKFLSWKGLRCQVFNVGQLRRIQAGGAVQDHNFFDPHNQQAKEERERLAQQSLQIMLDWLCDGDPVHGPAAKLQQQHEIAEPHLDLLTSPCARRSNRPGEVAIFDATNSTKARRASLVRNFNEFAERHKMTVHVVFIESICTNEAVLNANIAQKVISSPDYKHLPEEEAIADLKMRMKNYEAAYEALDDQEDLSYIKLFDLQSKVHAKGIYGHVAKSILPYMLSFHIEHRPIWLVRAGHCCEVRVDHESMDKGHGVAIATRSAKLSPLGIDFARSLAEFVDERTKALREARTAANSTISDTGKPTPLLVMTSTLPRAVETAQFLPQPANQHATLNPLDKGEAYGLSMEEMREQMPVRQLNRLLMDLATESFELTDALGGMNAVHTTGSVCCLHAGSTQDPFSRWRVVFRFDVAPRARAH